MKKTKKQLIAEIKQLKQELALQKRIADLRVLNGIRFMKV